MKRVDYTDMACGLWGQISTLDIRNLDASLALGLMTAIEQTDSKGTETGRLGDAETGRDGEGMARSRNKLITTIHLKSS